MRKLLLSFCTPIFILFLLGPNIDLSAQAPAIEWQQSYGGTEADFMNVALSSSDCGYFFAGDSYSSMTGNKTENSNGNIDFWFLKYDLSSKIEWQNFTILIAGESKFKHILTISVNYKLRITKTASDCFKKLLINLAVPFNEGSEFCN